MNRKYRFLERILKIIIKIGLFWNKFSIFENCHYHSIDNAEN